ncbi:MAG: TrkA family potassium uptake protein [Planctomycetes bacterium]|nr:TrkA family potassium uptake protein [Planctomycetota bacterium]
MRQFAVIGLGRFGYKVAATLAEKGADVLAVDENEEIIQKISDEVARAVVANSTDEDALRACAVQEVDVVVVGIGQSIESNVLTTALVKKLGVPEIVSRASSELHGQILDLVGATRVVFPEHDAAIRVANSIRLESIFDRIELPGGVTIAEIDPPASFIGKTLMELQLRTRYGINVIVVKQSADKEEEAKEIQMMPRPDYEIEKGDTLLVVGETESIESVHEYE